MRILIPIKRVVDPYTKVRPLPNGAGIDTTGVKFEINPFDEIAVEEAVRLRDKHGDVEIVAVSIGESECEEQLRKALAMGADRAILIESDQAFDSLCIAKELAEVAHVEHPDLILMGKQATDDDCNQAGQMLAAKLNWPQATFASKIERMERSLLVTRENDDGEETLEVPLPCVVTTDLRLNEPRYIGLPGIIKARSKRLDRQSPFTVPAPKTRTVRIEAAAGRQPGRIIANVTELVSVLKERGAL